MEGDMENDPLMDLPQPQSLLQHLYLLGLRRLQHHVAQHDRLLPQTQRAQKLGLGDQQGERVGTYQAQGGRI